MSLTFPPGQVGKVLGDKWKALSEKGREPYEKKAAEDKKRYEAEKAKYNVRSSSPLCLFLILTCTRLLALTMTKSKWQAPHHMDAPLA